MYIMDKKGLSKLLMERKKCIQKYRKSMIVNKDVAKPKRKYTRKVKVVVVEEPVVDQPVVDQQPLEQQQPKRKYTRKLTNKQ